MSASDEIARMRAETDQGREGLKEMGKAVFVFYESLRAAGFNEQQALDLTETWLTTVVQSASATGVMEQMLRDLGEDGS
jgi:hypothetical protein